MAEEPKITWWVDELVWSAQVLAAAPLNVGAPEATPVRKRQRKPTLAAALKQAKEAGVSVVGATIEDGKVSLTFGEIENEQAPATPLEQWRAKRRG
jgi:hypothetical protein